VASDITERKLVELALLEARNYTQTLLAASPTAIITYKASGEVVSANEAAARLVGTTIENLKRQNFRELASWRESNLLAMAEVTLATGKTQSFESHFVSTFGVESWADCQFVPFEHAGEPHLLLVAKDSTERKQAEGSLRQSEERYRLSEQATQDGLWDWNLLTDEEYFSPRWKEIIGLQNDEIPGHKSEFLKRVHPQDLPKVQAMTSEHLATGRRYEVEFRLRHKDGSYRWVFSRGKAVRDASGRPVRMVGSTREITELKAAQENQARLAAIVQSSLDGIISKSLDGTITTWNQGAEKLFGFAAEEIIGASILRLIPAERQAEEHQILARISRGENVMHFDTVRRRKGGQLFDASVTASPIRDANGQVIGVSKAVRDITDRKRLERALKTIGACDQALVHAKSEAELLQQVCRVIVELGGYRMVWVGFAENNEAKTMRVAAVAGQEAGYLATAKISWNEADERGRGPTGQAMRTGQTVICQDMRTDPNCAPWREAAKAHGYVSSTTLPLLHGGNPFGILAIYAAEAQAFQSAEVALLSALSEDLAYGIQALRTRQEHQLAEAQVRRLTVFPELNPNPVLEFGPDGALTYHNQAAWDLSRALELSGVAALLPPRVDEWVRQCLATNQLRLREEIIHGSRVLSASFYPIRKVNAVHCYMGDITERKRDEDQLKVQISALTAAANAIVITDRHGKIEWVNPAFTKLTGYSAEEAVGGNPRVLKSGEHPAAFYGTMWATVLTGNVWHGELVNKRKDGRLYTEEMIITPVRGEAGQIAHFVAVKQDITERRQMEKRMQQAQKMEAIGQLAGGIAHDFNNMLAAMFGYAHLLQQDTVGNPLAQESVAEILVAANRAKDLVQQILSFSRQREQKPQIISLDLVIKEVIKFLRASLPAQIKIENELAAETPAVLADPTQIYQIAMNLATNALHAMEDAPGRLLIRLDPVQPDEKLLKTHPELKPMLYARLTVADTGHGMDAKTMERIFEPFFTTKPVGRGTGLGLAVVHGIVESHKGVITVESQVGQGTTFCLYFPAQMQDLPVTASDASAVPHGHGQKILALDDEPALTSVLQRMLQRLDYQVTTSNQASEAIRLVRDNPAQFDLLITDLAMPEMSGLEVANQIHTLRPELPVILVSGYSVSVDSERLREAGICERLDKPVSPSTLAEVLVRVLKQV
jgi:PAS domain S-box-containing protein